MRNVLFRDLGKMDFQTAWQYQESLLKENIAIKSLHRQNTDAGLLAATKDYLLFVEHPPVYTLGKSGHLSNLLISEEEMNDRGIDFFHTNRGGDITFHGPGQIVAYLIFDLEYYQTDIGKYLRNLEEVVIRTLASYDIPGLRSAGETGVWIDSGIEGRARKICAMGIRCSRWITMHGLALNVHTDLRYFDHIIPCGIENKRVSSIEAEVGRPVDMEVTKELLKSAFADVFGVKMLTAG
ncbi:MAG: lipoyl(octanoyl) transferase LipB [Chitinophagaceae bacterium]